MALHTTHSYSRYVANGIQQSFPITFSFHNEKDIVVNIFEGRIKKLLRLTIEYSIEYVAGGANIVFTTPPAQGNIVVVERQKKQVQELSLHANSTLDLEVLEHSLDSIVMMIQEASQKIYKLQEEGEFPNAKEYEDFYTYIQKALHTITTSDANIDVKYKEIEKMYAIICEIAQNPPSSGGGGGEGGSSLGVVEHNLSASAHNNSLVPVGCVAYFMRATPPEGWLILEKKVYRREEYPALSTLLYCGDENNSTASFGYYCTDAENPEESRSVVGEYFMLGPECRGEFIRSLDANRGLDAGRVLGSMQESEISSHTHTTFRYGAAMAKGSSMIHTVALGTQEALPFEGGEELRPQNIALLTCIKY